MAKELVFTEAALGSNSNRPLSPPVEFSWVKADALGDDGHGLEGLPAQRGQGDGGAEGARAGVDGAEVDLVVLVEVVGLEQLH